MYVFNVYVCTYSIYIETEREVVVKETALVTWFYTHSAITTGGLARTRRCISRIPEHFINLVTHTPTATGHNSEGEKRKQAKGIIPQSPLVMKSPPGLSALIHIHIRP